MQYRYDKVTYYSALLYGASAPTLGQVAATAKSAGLNRGKTPPADRRQVHSAHAACWLPISENYLQQSCAHAVNSCNSSA